MLRVPIWFIIIITSLAQCVQYADEKNFKLLILTKYIFLHCMPMIWHGGGALFNIILVCILLQDKPQPYCAVAAHWPEKYRPTPSRSVYSKHNRQSVYRITSSSQVNRSSYRDGFFF